MRRPLAAALCLCVALFACPRVAPAQADAVSVDSPVAVPAEPPAPTPAPDASVTPASATPTTPELTPITSPTTASTPPLPTEAARPRRPAAPHSGVMWRTAVGGALMHGWSETSGVSDTVSAFPAFALSVSLGHAIATDLVLHMDVSYARSGSATYSSEGETVVDDVSLTSLLVGAGLTYRFAEYDAFLTGGLGFGQISTVSGAFRLGTIELPDIESTKVGFGMHAGVGKHWRVGRRWGIGPLFQLAFMSPRQSFGDGNHLNLLTATLSISAAYD